MFSATKDDNISTLKNATPSFRENIEETKNDVRQAANKAANKAGYKIRDMVNSAGENFSQAKDTVTSQIRSNPLQSSLIALGVGFLLGALSRR